MDKSLRNTLRNVVTQCRRLLEEAVAELLEGQFGIYITGKVEPVDRMKHLSADDLEYREQLLIHLQHIQAAGFKTKDAVEQLVREVAFTHLNRFCAYKMMETRGLIRKAVSDGLKSQGFLFYLADNSAEERLYTEGKQDVAYRHFLEWLGSTLSEEIGVLFSPHDPANRLLPPQRIIDSVLNFINSEELKDIWVEDETIGWVYQYFTPKELRDKARKESQAPRNSYELAFRNQFYTPSYVVEFLTDNTLGRIWYEMRQGQTALIENCKYLVRRPHEVFLAPGKEVPVQEEQAEDLSQEELLKQPVYILHRPKKDPREIKILDPACGSGHFLIYCFSLLLIIYEEAYDDPDLASALQRDYPDREVYSKTAPALILAHNLHGIDIDIRATQIAALALWLRAQRAYQEMGIRKNRPKITKSNIVCAEPMPGEKELLDEFVAELQPTVLGQLVQVVFEKMKLAGEAGSLLKIEEEIRNVVAEAKQQWKNKPKPKQLVLLPQYEKLQPEQMNLFDLAGVTDEEFWLHAEALVVDALQEYANRAVGSNRLLRQLFAGDAVQGFAFIDICRKHFDVVLMNPPFGLASKQSKDFIDYQYQTSRYDLAATFIDRAYKLVNKYCLIGVICTRTPFFLPTLSEWRDKNILKDNTIQVFADLGHGILDTAMVEVAALTIQKTLSNQNGVFFQLLGQQLDKNQLLYESLTLIKKGLRNNITFVAGETVFRSLPKYPFCYWAPINLVKIFQDYETFDSENREAWVGLQTNEDFRWLRLAWEVSQIELQNTWFFYAKGGEYSLFYSGLYLVVNWANKGQKIKQWKQQQLEQGHITANNSKCWNEGKYFRRGITWTHRTTKNFSPRILPDNCIFGIKGPAAFDQDNDEKRLLVILAILCSTCFQSLLQLQVAAADAAARQYDAGLIRRTPFPNISQLSDSNKLEQLSIEAFQLRQFFDLQNETSSWFTLPPLFYASGETLKQLINDWQNLHKYTNNKIIETHKHINNSVFEIYGISTEIINTLESQMITESRIIDYDENEEDNDECNFLLETNTVILSLFSWIMGVFFGRFDLRLAINKQIIPKLPKPFTALPICSPGMLTDSNALPATSGNIVSEEWLCSRPDANTLPPEGSVQQFIIADSEYPIPVKWDGILVDDLDHPDDIIHRVRDVLQVIWGDNSEAIEQEACEILGVKNLRDYFRKPSNGGFWTDHIKRYSKSRRKAPIYWLLQSSNKNYSIWIYYHRLDKDILFKALVNYVEPKLRLEESNLQQLRSQQETVGTSGKAAKQLEKQIDRQESLISELYDFQDKLRRAANLNLEPDLNDGVVLNIAPLWEIVPWSEAKKYWQELIAGKYEWSSIGKQLRAKGIISV